MAGSDAGAQTGPLHKTMPAIPKDCDGMVFSGQNRIVGLVLAVSVLLFGCVATRQATAQVILVDNLNTGTGATQDSVDNNEWLSTAFNTGSFSDAIESVVLRMSKAGVGVDQSTLQVSLNQNAGVEPGSVITTLSTTDAIFVGSNQDITFTPTIATTLSPATNYWIVVGVDPGATTDSFNVGYTNSPDEDSSFGAFIANFRFSSNDSGVTWSEVVGPINPLRMQVNAVPEPSSFVLLGLCLAGLGVGVWRRRKTARRVDANG